MRPLPIKPTTIIASRHEHLCELSRESFTLIARGKRMSVSGMQKGKKEP
ncbi:MAG: hypothetical protein ACE5OP_10735 [Candidatus Glassbacteria bacterium]